jgi:hypothetical protein
MQFETALAKESLDNVALRDPQAIDHKMTFAGMKQLAPLFDWDEFFSTAKLQREGGISGQMEGLQ